MTSWPSLLGSALELRVSIQGFLLQCVAAFAVSAVASQWERTGKPFNPLLGETYELVRLVSVPITATANCFRNYSKPFDHPLLILLFCFALLCVAMWCCVV